MLFTFTGAMTFPFGLLSAPLTYSAPTLGEMIAKVRQDLRDPDAATFTDDELRDMIQFGFVEVSRIYPKEVVDHITFAANTFNYPTFAQDPFRVEIFKANGAFITLERATQDSAESGWDFFAETVWLPSYISFIAVDDILRVWGYGHRFIPSTDDDICDVDDQADVAIRLYAVLTGYQKLLTDRMAYSQWNTSPGNTDVSLPMVTTVAQTYDRQWSEVRRRLKTLRRV